MGPHPGIAAVLDRGDARSRELADAARIERETLPVSPQLADTDPQRTPRGWQGGDS
jgi:hypothetical protein